MDVAERLQAIIDERRLKQNWVATEAGMSSGALSRILNGITADPGIYAVSRLAKVLGESVASLLGERGFELLRHERAKVVEVIDLLRARILTDSNAATVVAIPLDQAGRVSRRRATVRPPSERKTAPRRRTAATPDRETFADEAELPEREIPAHYYELGARLIYKSEGNSMVNAGITDRDLLFVKPSSDIRDARDRVVVCGVRGSEYVKRLKLENDRIVLASDAEGYREWTIDEDADRFKLIGVVVGRSGYTR